MSEDLRECTEMRREQAICMLSVFQCYNKFSFFSFLLQYSDTNFIRSLNEHKNDNNAILSSLLIRLIYLKTLQAIFLDSRHKID